MARCSGVLPSRPRALVWAPWVSSTMAQSRRPLCTAMCSAMSAVPLLAFTSAPYSSSSRVSCPRAHGPRQEQIKQP